MRKKPHQTLGHVGIFPGTALSTPCFFPSVSGAAKVPRPGRPIDYLRLIAAYNPLGAVLVSAYDIAHADSVEDFCCSVKCARVNNRVLLDSGFYELIWLHREKTEARKRRVWNKTKYHNFSAKVGVDARFGLDSFRSLGTDMNVSAQTIAKSIKKTCVAVASSSVYPILHTKNFEEEFPSFCAAVALNEEGLRFPLIAIPERDLGDDVIEIAVNIRKIRTALNERKDEYCYLHILGAGSPLSILIYSACGADSFDGIDWCQTVAEYGTGRLYHPMLLPFFGKGEYPLKIGELSGHAKMLAHNLSFYDKWMKEVRQHIEQGAIIEMMDRILPPAATEKIRRILAP